MTRARLITACLASSEREMNLRVLRKGCAAVTCREQVNPGRIFCLNHWNFLPPFVRRAILNTFRDCEWDAHREAIRQGADFVDAAKIDARAEGFSELVPAKQYDSARSRGKQVRYAGRAVACAWLDTREAQIDAAITFLKAKCILVSAVERDHPIRAYRVSGRGGYWLAEDVVDLAARKGFAG